ncbi:acyl-CoA dehydrogenase family protein [Novosphingobium colocasiae]|nr:acyl-CoA dehydrogenase family protein [Novosphingobium colocasiae]
MTEERVMIQQLARDFTRDVVRPLADRLDPEHADFPLELIDQMGELGFFGIVIPEELGGLGLGAYEYCLVTEELAKGWMSVASVPARGNAFFRTISGSDEFKREKIALMAQGKYIGAAAFSEPNTGSDLSNVSCRARREGDEWVITGSKYWCTFADGVDFIRVLCRVDDGTGKGGTVNIHVHKPRGQLPEGVTGSPIPKIGYFGWKTWELFFDGVRVPVDPYAPEPGRGFQDAAFGLQLARAQTAARSLGVAQAALDHAIEYAKERIQFGQPISDFQAIRFKIADMATQVEAVRQLLYHTCDEIDSGRSGKIKTSMIKYLAAEMAEKVTSEAMQILGGAGYTTLHPVERFWRDARLTKIFEGTSEIQLRIVSDAMLGKPVGKKG